MKHSTHLIISLSLLLFVILQILGFTLAHHKPLWRDELNTQTYAINESYADLLAGKNDMEGNKSPLFYIQQKLFCDLFHFHTPQAWLEKRWEYTDPFANIFLRILPVTWMSLFFLLLFVYFSWRFNILIGLLGVFVSFSSPLLWLYWAEARPYGLWVLLTGLQMVLFLEILNGNNNFHKKWLMLSIVHILLSLTCVLSVIQIGIVNLMLLFKDRRWQNYILCFVIPMFFIYFYQPHTPSNDLVFLITVPQMIFSAIPPNQLYIFLFYPLLLRLYGLQTQKILPQIFTSDEIMTVLPFFLSLALMTILFILFLTYLHAHATGQGQFIVTRHIICLTPMSVIAITLLSGLVWQSIRSYTWIKFLILGVVAGLLLFHIDIVWEKIYFLFTQDLYS